MVDSSLLMSPLFLMSYLGAISSFLLGTIIGSLLNVCVSRWPRGESIIKPRSRCMACGTHVFWYDNVPILSYLLLKGACRHCKGRIGRRYFWMELGMGLLFLFSWAHFPWPEACVCMVFFSLLMTGSVIDLEHFTLPEPLLILGFLFGCFLSAMVPSIHGERTAWAGLGTALMSLCLVSGGLMWFSALIESVLRRPAMGLGDAYWLGMIASFTGVWGGVFSFFIGAMLGSIFILFAWLWEKSTGRSLGPRVKAEALSKIDFIASEENCQADLTWGVAIPFGPWLSMAAALYFSFFQSKIPSIMERFVLNVSYLLAP